MKPEEQRIAIAKACGLTILSDGITHHLTPCGKKTERDPEGCLLKECPDYLNDLNAIHEAEKALLISSFMWETYSEILAAISDCNEYEPFAAAAIQRAEALLKTIGKWEE